MPVRPPQGHWGADGLPDTRILPPTCKARAAPQDWERVDTHLPLPVAMPSRQTVVISLDQYTTALLDEVKEKGQNVSAHVRRALVAYAQPIGEAEQLSLLAEARYKQIKTLKKQVRTLVVLLDTLGDVDGHTVLGRKLSDVREAVFDE